MIEEVKKILESLCWDGASTEDVGKSAQQIDDLYQQKMRELFSNLWTYSYNTGDNHYLTIAKSLVKSWQEKYLKEAQDD